MENNFIDSIAKCRDGSSFQVPYLMHDEFELDLFIGARNRDEHPLWGTDRIELKSVGIDIGSSTSHLMFSRLVLCRLGTKLSSKFVVVDREITWKSDIILTPYVSRHEIDVEGLSKFINRSYLMAGMDSELIDTGAVIVTGEASRKENAEAITGLFSREAGKFVCATAGPKLEARIAAYGCGGVKKSIGGDNGRTILIVDIGGGTTKFAVVKNGTVLETAATNIGGRLVAEDAAGRIVRIEEAGKLVAQELGVELAMGKKLEVDKKEALATILADLLLETIEDRSPSSLAESLMITSKLTYQGKIDRVMFSGGVAEYIYGSETRDYGDLGKLLGKRVLERVQRPAFGIPIETAEERIRATVIGASQYSIQVSGSTIFVSNVQILPIKNLRVVFPRIGETPERFTPQRFETAIREAIDQAGLDDGEEPIALAFHWFGEPRYMLLRALSDGIVLGLKKTIQKGLPITLVFNSDIGKLVGSILYEEIELSSDVISIDQLHLHDFEYIDIGQILEKTGTIPIIIKSLVFGKHAEEKMREIN